MDQDPVNIYSAEMMRKLLNIQIELCDQYKARESRVRKALYLILETHASEVIEDFLQAGKPLENNALDEFAEIVRATINTKFQKYVEAEITDQTIGQIKQPDLTLNDDHSISHRQIEKEQDREDFEKSYLDYQEEFTQWQQTKGFERDQMVLKLIGETGLSRLPQLKHMLANEWQLKSSGGNSILTVLTRIENLGLFIQRQVTASNQASYGGRYPNVGWLTEKGKAFYFLLKGSSAKESVYLRLLRDHKSAEHTLLIMQVADFLEAQGYLVERFLSPIHLEGNRICHPDLKMENNEGESIFIEVERDVNKSDRSSKWLNLYEFTQGNIYVICDKKTGMQKIRNEICSILRTRPGSVFLSNYFALNNGERGKDGGIWLETRHIKKGNDHLKEAVNALKMGVNDG